MIGRTDSLPDLLLPSSQGAPQGGGRVGQEGDLVEVSVLLTQVGEGQGPGRAHQPGLTAEAPRLQPQRADLTWLPAQSLEEARAFLGCELERCARNGQLAADHAVS